MKTFCACIIIIAALAHCGPNAAEQQRRYDQARAATAAGKLEAARTQWRAVYTADPHYRDATLQYGRVLYYTKQYGEAVRVLEDTDDAGSRYWLARAQAEQPNGRQAALATLEKIVSANPNDGEAWLLKAQLHEEAGQIEPAIEALKNTIRQQRTLARAHARLGRIYRNVNLPTQAAESQRMAETLAPDDAVVREAESTGKQQ